MLLAARTVGGAGDDGGIVERMDERGAGARLLPVHPVEERGAIGVRDVGRALEPSDPDLQLLLPRHRVDVTRDPTVLRAELRREWPEDADKLEAALGALASHYDVAGFFLKAAPPLPPDGLGEKLAVRKALKTALSAPNAPSDPVGKRSALHGLDDHELVRSLRTAARFLTYLDGPISPMSEVRLLGGALRSAGVHAVRIRLKAGRVRKTKRFIGLREWAAVLPVRGPGPPA